ncbi:acyltransferase family protein [Polluticoccus soli]|uniref:acyltransferase family protein n=1 Tax=Polluticoccus soli TaxID=3034150 RepID=UPI0023E256C1|nr:acyltransferase [Flavipsychrobacter sp. JY13-12]
MNRIVSIQLLRAIACLLVLLLHIMIFVPNPPFWIGGNFGVDLFFVISGYIIASSIDRLPPHKRAANFAINRFSRVVPYYWLMTLIYAGTFIAAGAWFSYMNLWLSLVFYPKEPVMLIGWTLNHEVFFYAFIAGCLLLTRTVRHWFNLVLFVSVILVCRSLNSNINTIKFIGASVNLTFALGYLAFITERHWVKYLQSKIVLWLAVLMLAVTLFNSDAYTIPTGYPRDFVNYAHSLILPRFSWGIIAALFFTVILAQESRIKAGTNKLVVRIGDTSYTIYLIQGLMVQCLASLTPLPLWGVPIVFAVVVLVSFRLYRVEDWLGRTTKKGLKTLLDRPKDQMQPALSHEAIVQDAPQGISNSQ